MRQVILFDIDGTLVTSRGGGKAAMERAALELFGLEHALDGVKMHGNTDPLIFQEIMRRAGVRGQEAYDALLAKYLEIVPSFFESHGVTPLPHVPEVLARLRDAGFVLSLVTGNVRDTARLKLAAAGLDRFFDFSLGGYGSDAGDRRHILAAALDRIGGDAAVLLVGDTPYDVTAARANGIPCMAVATGPHSVTELLGWGADAAAATMEPLTPDLAGALAGVTVRRSDDGWHRLHG